MTAEADIERAGAAMHDMRLAKAGDQGTKLGRGKPERHLAAKHAAFKPGSSCANCQFFTAATGACTLFPGFAVAPKGWCSAWAKKA